MGSRDDLLEEEGFAREVVSRIEQPKKVSGRPGKRRTYPFYCAVWYVLRTGVPCRDVPEIYGRWPTIDMRFKRWSESGLLVNGQVRRPRIGLVPGQEEAMLNAHRLKERAKVEHAFRMIQCPLGFHKGRYQGLLKNTAQRLTLFILANLWQVRKIV